MQASSTGRPLLTLQDLEAGAGKRGGASPTLRIPGALEVPPGIHLVTGKSGHGKSLLLSLLAGYPMAEATVRVARLAIDGASFPGLTGHEVAARLLRKALCRRYRTVPCIFLPQNLPIVAKGLLTVAELLREVSNGICVTLGRENKFRKQAIEAQITATFGKTPWRDRLIGLLAHDVGTLSGGERRRVEVSARLIGLRVLAAKEMTRALIILDEPTTGLDDENAAAFFDFIAEACNGRTAFLIATHVPGLLHGRACSALRLEKTEKAGAAVCTVTQTWFEDGRQA